MRICALKLMMINFVFTNMLLAQSPHEMLEDCISYYNNGQYRLAHDRCKELLQMPDINDSVRCEALKYLAACYKSMYMEDSAEAVLYKAWGINPFMDVTLDAFPARFVAMFQRLREEKGKKLIIFPVQPDCEIEIRKGGFSQRFKDHITIILPQGRYSFSVRKSGFKPYKDTISLMSDTILRINLIRPIQYGKLSVSSTPVNSVLIVDNNIRTPFVTPAILELPYGEHTFVFSAPGYYPMRTRYTVVDSMSELTVNFQQPLEITYEKPDTLVLKGGDKIVGTIIKLDNTYAIVTRYGVIHLFEDQVENIKYAMMKEPPSKGNILLCPLFGRENANAFIKYGDSTASIKGYALQIRFANIPFVWAFWNFENREILNATLHPMVLSIGLPIEYTIGPFHIGNFISKITGVRKEIPYLKDIKPAIFFSINGYVMLGIIDSRIQDVKHTFYNIKDWGAVFNHICVSFHAGIKQDIWRERAYLTIKREQIIWSGLGGFVESYYTEYGEHIFRYLIFDETTDEFKISETVEPGQHKIEINPTGGMWFFGVEIKW